MNEQGWQRLERRLIDAHVAAEPPLSGAIWRGVEAGLAARPARRGVRLAMGVVVALAAAGVALWFLPTEPRRPEVVAPARERAPTVAEVTTGPPTAPTATASSASTPESRATASSAASVESDRSAASAVTLNQVVETTRAVTFAIAADAGRIEVEPCLGRFVNVTVLDSPHRALRLVAQGRRVEARFDDGAVLAAGVAHVMVPADTHLIISTRSGPVVVRGLGGPMEIDTQSGEVRTDTAPRLDPIVTIASDSGAIAWQGRCGRGCRVEARSRAGDITLRAPDRSPFNRGAARGESREGRVHLEELTCTDPRCSSSPLPWRQPAAGKSH
jgi:hypothetical protein